MSTRDSAAAGWSGEVGSTPRHPAAAALLLGRAWLEKGNDAAAEEHLRRALVLHPDSSDAHRYLAYLRLRQNRLREAVEHIEKAGAGGNPELRHEIELLRDLAGISHRAVDLPDQEGGRLRFTKIYAREHHRSGWRYAQNALYGLHHGQGVRCEGFLEDPFAWQHPRDGVRSGAALLEALRGKDYAQRITSEERHEIPYREPWVGFLHNPPNMPPWFHYDESPQTILAKPVWRQSLPYCVGLFTLSEYAAQWLRKATGKPVSAVFHPTETPDLKFDFERFLANPDKRIVQVGWWLRHLGSLDRLPLAAGNALGYRKLRLIPAFFEGAAAYLQGLRQREVERDGPPLAEHAANTDERYHVGNEEYDRLLSENIVFVHLIDASANNAVLECIVRATPILVNRLPAVEEYLGAEYPLYFDDLEHAARLALDAGRLRDTHSYLRELPIRHRLDAASFRRAVEESDVYRRL